MTETNPPFSPARPGEIDVMIRDVEIGRPLSRRRFIQLLAGVAAGELVASQLGPLRRALGVAPTPSNQGVLIVLYMGGGNDGLNMVVPHGQSAYYANRPTIGVPAAQTLALASGLGLHPSLVNLKRRFDAGKVAVVQGIGYTPPNLSHFSSGDQWSFGAGAPGSAVVAPRNGWLGRWLDSFGQPNFVGNQVKAVSFGELPLYLRGDTTTGLVLPYSASDVFGSRPTNASEARVYSAVNAMNVTTGLGSYGDALAALGARAIAAAGSIGPVYANMPAQPSSLQRQLIMAANVVNADLGVRVISVVYGGFDTHDDQTGWHSHLLSDLDTSIESFYARVDPTRSNRVSILTYSEFGRRVEENTSGGTDHGSASSSFVIGDNVRGGIHGATPSLTNLDRDDNMRASVDFRSVYSTLLGSWLGADPVPIVQAVHTTLDLFTADPGVVPGATTTTTSSTSSTSTTSTSTTSTSTSSTSTSSTSTSTTAPTTTSTVVVSSTAPMATTSTSTSVPAESSTTTIPGVSTSTTPDPSSSTTTPSTTALVASTSTSTTSTTSSTLPPSTTSPTTTSPSTTLPTTTAPSTVVSSTTTRPSTTGPSTSTTTSTTPPPATRAPNPADRPANRAIVPDAPLVLTTVPPAPPAGLDEPAPTTTTPNADGPTTTPPRASGASTLPTPTTTRRPEPNPTSEGGTSGRGPAFTGVPANTIPPRPRKATATTRPARLALAPAKAKAPRKPKRPTPTTSTPKWASLKVKKG